MLLNRWKELGQERNGELGIGSSSSRITTTTAPISPVAGNGSDMDIIDSNSDDMPSENPRLSVDKSTGHISIVPSSATARPRHSVVTGDNVVNGVNSSSPYAWTAFDRPSQNVLPSPVVTEQGEDGEERDDLPLIFLGVVFGVIPSQWYSKSLSKWHSGVEALGGRFITPPTESVPDLVLLPLSDERSDLATPVEADVPEHWQCPIAVTSWITQCVMAGKLFELHNPEVPILGLDPLAVRVMERQKGRQSTPMARPDGAASTANALQSLSTQISRMSESMASQNAAVRAFVDGQGALHSQMRQMASAIDNLAEQLHRSHQATSQRIDHLSGLIQHRRRQPYTRDLHDSSSKIYAAVTDEARRVSGFGQRLESFVQLVPDRIGAEQRQLHGASSLSYTPASGARSRASALFSRAGPLPSPPDHDNLISLPDTTSGDHHSSSSQRHGHIFRTHVNGPADLTVPSSPRGGNESSRDASRSERTAVGYSGAISTSTATARDPTGAVPATQLGPLATISPTELQSLLHNVFSETPQKDHEAFWRRARSIYIEHLGQRAPRRVSITHVSGAQAVFPNRYLYDKIIFVSTVPGEDALAVLFDMKEREVVIYDTVDRYRNNLFTFGKEKTLAESFGLKDAAWYVVELVAETEKEDSFPLVCLATKIFASRDRKSFRDLFPPHVVVAKKNIKNPIPPRRQAKADYYWRLVRPRVVQHLVKELSTVLLTRYRHEETHWVNVPKCSEWVEGLTRFEDSEEAKELPDGRFKGENNDRPVPRDNKEAASRTVPTESVAQRPPVEEFAPTQSASRLCRAGEETEQQQMLAVSESIRSERPESGSFAEPQEFRGSQPERQQQKRPAETEPIEDPTTKKQRMEDNVKNMPSALEQLQTDSSSADNQSLVLVSNINSV